MRRLILAAIAVAAIAAPAFAQTVPAPVLVTKAPPMPGYPQKCGFYYGLDAEGISATVPNAPAGTNVIGGDIGVLVGYACQFSQIPYFVEGIFDFQNLNAGTAGFSLTGPAHLEQRVGVQTPLLQFLPALGFPSTGTIGSLPVLPPGVTVNGAAQNYLYAAVNEDDISASLGVSTATAWLVSPEIGTGMLVPLKLGNGWNAVADVWAGVELQTNSICLGSGVGSMCPKLGTGYRTGVSFKF